MFFIIYRTSSAWITQREEMIMNQAKTSNISWINSPLIYEDILLGWKTNELLTDL